MGRSPRPGAFCEIIRTVTRQHSIHCRHCGHDNPIESDVLGKLCDQCGQDIYAPEFEAEIAARPKTPVATVDRTGDVLRVTCPHCQFRNEFPEFSVVDTFLCDDCGEPVAVEEPVQ
jgi:hypothetical protein